MGALYVAALILGAGTLAVQLLAPADTDGAADGGHDLSSSHDATHDGGSGILPLILALRFWTYALLAFGLCGTLLHYLKLLDTRLVPFVAGGMGLASGLLASYVVRSLTSTQTSSGAEASDVVGQVGKVLLPVSRSRRGKVRFELKGQTLDMIATTSGEELTVGSLVFVEEVRGSEVHVSRAEEPFVPRLGD